METHLAENDAEGQLTEGEFNVSTGATGNESSEKMVVLSAEPRECASSWDQMPARISVAGADAHGCLVLCPCGCLGGCG